MDDYRLPTAVIYTPGVTYESFQKPRARWDSANVRRKFTLRERLQETPESHSRNPIISPELIEKLLTYDPYSVKAEGADLFLCKAFCQYFPLVSSSYIG